MRRNDMVHRSSGPIWILTAVACVSSCAESALWEPTSVRFAITIHNNTHESRYISFYRPYDILQGEQVRSLIGNRLCSRCGTVRFDMCIDPELAAVEIEAQRSIEIENQHVWYETRPATSEVCVHEAVETCMVAHEFAAGLYELRVPYATREMAASQGLEQTDRILWGGTIWRANTWGVPTMETGHPRLDKARAPERGCPRMPSDAPWMPEGTWVS